MRSILGVDAFHVNLIASNANETINAMINKFDFSELLTYLRRVPSVSSAIGSGEFENGTWWIKFSLDIKHPLVWSVVQEFGCVLNYLSVSERLPTVFMPVSPAPYLNGGPTNFLSWVIESKEASFTPDDAMKWLASRLPNPVDDETNWEIEET